MFRLLKIMYFVLATFNFSILPTRRELGLRIYFHHLYSQPTFLPNLITYLLYLFFTHSLHQFNPLILTTHYLYPFHQLIPNFSTHFHHPFFAPIPSTSTPSIYISTHLLHPSSLYPSSPFIPFTRSLYPFTLLIPSSASTHFAISSFPPSTFSFYPFPPSALH